MKHLISFSCLWLLFLPLSCAQGETVLPLEIRTLNDSLTNVYAPDKRVSLFDIRYSVNQKFITLQGVTTSAEAHQALLQGLSRLNYEVTDFYVVGPYDNSIKDQREEAELTLFTCAEKGSMRFVVKCIMKEDE